MPGIVTRLVRPALLPFRFPVETARHYSFGKLRRDLVAGLTVSVVEVPQAMAYALIAGVPPQYGIYASIIQGILGALLSSSSHLVTGPTNTQSLLVTSALYRLMGSNPDLGVYLQFVFTLGILKGLIQLAFASARMGNMVRYVSRSVIVGLTAGVGVLIAVGQVPHFLGIDIADTTRTWHGLVGALQQIVPHLHEVDGQALGIGVGCLALLLTLPRLWRYLPASLLAVVAGAAVVWLMGWTQGQVPLAEPLPRGLPRPHLPHVTLAQAEALFSGALALAILGLIEPVAIAKTLAARSGERISANQEFFAQGFQSFVSGFFQCLPGSGSFTRSALLYDAGGQTRFAPVCGALFVAMIFWLGAPLAGLIPLAALAAILLVIAFGLINWSYLFRISRTSRSDAGVCLVTFAATLIAPLEYAIFIGVFLNIAFYLRKASKLHVAEMVPGRGGVFLERPLNERMGLRKAVFLQFEGNLFFALADELQDRLNALAASPVQVVILRLKRTHALDATVLSVFEDFVRQMQQRGGHVVLCGLTPHLMKSMTAFGLIDLVGRANVFETGFGVFTSAKLAIERARQLTGQTVETDDFADAETTWNYEI